MLSKAKAFVHLLWLHFHLGETIEILKPSRLWYLPLWVCWVTAHKCLFFLQCYFESSQLCMTRNPTSVIYRKRVAESEWVSRICETVNGKVSLKVLSSLLLCVFVFESARKGESQKERVWENKMRAKDRSRKRQIEGRKRGS